MTDLAPARAAPLARAHQPGGRRWVSASTPGPVREFHATLPGYWPTPLISLPDLAAEFGVATVWVKDEADRFGLPAFKILGASWAVNRALSVRAGHVEPARSLDELRQRVAGSGVTLVTATDGNHGRALARMARLLDVRARIHVPAGLGAAAVDAIAAEGAEMVHTSLIYDEVVETVARSVEGRADDVLVQDTSWPGYEDIPRWIVEGYSTLFAEIDDRIGGTAASSPFRPGSGRCCRRLCSTTGPRRGRTGPRSSRSSPPPPRASPRRCAPAGGPVDTSSPTIMAGLNCGTVSESPGP